MIDNLPKIFSCSATNADDQEISDLVADEDLAALKSNSIHLGDCYINERKQLLFTMKNLSKSQCYRFEWQQHQGLNFTAGNTSSSDHGITMGALGSFCPTVQLSPRVGHLHAGCSKDITITFKSSEPIFLKNELMQCLLTKISFDQPIDEVRFLFSI